jgi:hypothetical protein
MNGTNPPYNVFVEFFHLFQRDFLPVYVRYSCRMVLIFAAKQTYEPILRLARHEHTS